MEFQDLSEQEQQACENGLAWADPPDDVIGLESVRMLWRLSWCRASEWVKSRTVAEGEHA